MDDRMKILGGFIGDIQGEPLPDGFHAGSSAADRAGKPVSDQDEKRMSADWDQLERQSYYQEMSPGDQDLLHSMFRQMELASRGTDDGAKMTRKALGRIVNGSVRVAFDYPLKWAVTALTQGNLITIDRQQALGNAGKPEWVTSQLVHEDTHVANHDKAGGVFEIIREEYRGYVEGHRASTGRDPAPEEAISDVETLLGDRYAGELSQYGRVDGAALQQVRGMEREIAAGKVDPRMLGIPEEL